MRTRLWLFMLLFGCSLVRAMLTRDCSFEDADLKSENEDTYDYEYDEKSSFLQLGEALDKRTTGTPNLVLLEKALRGRLSPRCLRTAFSSCLDEALCDFDRWEPALTLLQRYGANPNAIALYDERIGDTGDTLLLRKLIYSTCHQNAATFVKKVIEFLLKGGARIGTINKFGENAVYLALNPSEGCSESAKVVNSGVRVQFYRWFKETMTKILSESNRIEELKFLNSYRIFEEEMEAQQYIDAVLQYIFCPDLTKIIGGYAAAANLLIVRDFDNPRGSKRNRGERDSDSYNDSDIAHRCALKFQYKKIKDYCTRS